MKFILFLLCLTVSVYPQINTKIYPFDGNSYDRFGYKLSVDTNFLAISSQKDLQRGVVYIYSIKDTIKFVQKIQPDSSYTRYFFGSPVLFADSFLFIGANLKVFIYKKYRDSCFQKIDFLQPPDITQGYGRAISEFNKNLFIGSYQDGNHDKGAAYYYKYTDNGWVFSQKLNPSIAEKNAHFGNRVVHTDQFAVISAPGDGFESGPFRGSAFLFGKTDSGWVERQKILPPDSSYYQLFGIDLALDKKRIAIGAVGNVLNPAYTGRIYIYEINNEGLAELQDSIFGSDNFPGNNFGGSFKLRGDSLFVGACGNEYMKSPNNVKDQRNWAYLFVKSITRWEEKLIFAPSDPHPQNVFGYAVDFLNGKFLVGSPGDPTNGFQSGAAYLFQPNPTIITNEGRFPNCMSLFQNYPNPFNPLTIINYQLPPPDGRAGIDNWITLKVYDILGREVATLVDDYKSAGYHKVSWDASNMPSGVYIYKLSAGGFTHVKKMILVK